MEETWYVDRAKLRDLLVLHPDWPQAQLAAVLGRSVGWVKKWCRRFRDADPNDATILLGISRARKDPPQRISQTVIERILEIRR